MAELNYNSIYDGISLALHHAYPTAQIHGRTVKQDLHHSDFNVLPIAASHKGQISTRAERGMVFDVIYYPTEKGGREECLERADELSVILATITTPQGDKVHGTDLEYNIEDNVLHCTVRYPYFVYSPPDNDSMETIQTILEV